MIGLFTPRYVKEGKEMLKTARRMLHYKRDLLKPDEKESIEAACRELEQAMRRRDREEVARSSEKLEQLYHAHFPRSGQSALRENCEVLFVAIVIAVGVRTYFLQPFTIPTGSMQPTLNGVLATVTNEPAPNLFVRLLHFGLYGRSYVDLVSGEEDMVESVEDVRRFGFFQFTEVRCQRQSFLAHTSSKEMQRSFHVFPGRHLAAGEVIARGYVNTGDHVFVDKMRYQFIRPQRGQVFVFNTLGIPTGENVLHPGGPSQFYIKRLAGLPGDRLQIDPPKLFINGALATQPGFRRVMAAENGYHGYSNAPAGGPAFRYLGSPAPEDAFLLPPGCYFALGDNSYHSSDSRDWGCVPEKNIVGRGLFVYWPFTSHWGFIR